MMMKHLRFFASFAFIAMLLAANSLFAAGINQLQKKFDQPPDDARIMTRWW
jgi:hypothetical protein